MDDDDRTAPHESDVAAVSLLAEPQRLALYDFVCRQPDPVSRDQAAEAVGIQRSLAAFHLDRMAAGGLLAVEFRRLSGRTGPGAGRPAKLYRRSDREVEVSLPARDYKDLARVLTEALRAGGKSSVEQLGEIAAQRGRSIAEEAKRRASGTRGQGRLWQHVLAVLDEYGFEPRREGKRIVLGNCPFAALARDYPDIVCQANVAMLRGALDGLDTDAAEVRFHPGSSDCCVSLTGVPRQRN